MSFNSLLDALESVVEQIVPSDSNLRVDDGRFYLCFLGEDPEQTNSQNAWKIVQHRIETVFRPGLLDWNHVGSLSQYQHEHFSKTFLTSGKEELSFSCKVVLLCLYIAAVHDHQESLWAKLTSQLASNHQILLQKSFEYLLNNRCEMSSEALAAIFDQRSIFSTPLRGSSSVSGSLGESFTYSPRTACSPSSGSPLQDFFQNHSKSRLDSLQRNLRETKSVLDVEREEMMTLREELSKTNKEKEKLRQELEETRERFASANSENLRNLVPRNDLDQLASKYASLQEKLKELKDSNLYAKNLESQLEKMTEAKRSFEDSSAFAQAKIKENSVTLQKLNEALASAKMEGVEKSAENNTLKEAIRDLQKQLEDLQHFSSHRNSLASFETGFEDNLNEISVDNPQGIMSPINPGETMTDTVVLNLKEEITDLQTQVMTCNSEKENQKISFEGKIQELNQDIQAKYETIENISQQMREMEDNLSKVKDENMERSNTILKLETELASDKEMFKNNINALEDKYSQLQNQYNVVEMDRNRIILEKDNQISECSAQVHELRATLETKTNAFDQMSLEMKSLQESLSKATVGCSLSRF